MKNIILLSDGTGNSGGVGRGTNVWRLYESLQTHGPFVDPTVEEQLAFYDDGVGTQGLNVFRLLGNAAGWGLAQNVRQLYTYLVRHYEDGDRIFLFGFSRGAYTVRHVTGLIQERGILDPEQYPGDKLEAEVKRSFKQYRRGHGSGPPPGDTAWPLQAPDGNEPERMIEMVGVWDTVDAVGVPFDGLRGVLKFLFNYAFKDNDLAAGARHGYHALAIDDERRTFHPELWNERARKPYQTIEQVWFAGAHSNVGGGYPKDGMALSSLVWIMRKAAARGVCFKPGTIEGFDSDANPHAKLYNSRAGIAAYYRYAPRDMAGLTSKYGSSPANVHISAFHRIRHQTLGYAPTNLSPELKVVFSSPQEHQLTDSNTLEATNESTTGLRNKLWNDVTGWVRGRQGLYFGLVVCTAYLLAIGIAGDIILEGRAREPVATAETLLGLVVPDFLEDIALRLLAYPAWSLGGVAVLGILWLGSNKVRHKMQRLSIQAWKPWVTKVRSEYKPAAQAAQAAQAAAEPSASAGARTSAHVEHGARMSPAPTPTTATSDSGPTPKIRVPPFPSNPPRK